MQEDKGCGSGSDRIRVFLGPDPDLFFSCFSNPVKLHSDPPPCVYHAYALQIRLIKKSFLIIYFTG